MKNKTLALLGACGLLLASSASATLIVDFTNPASGSALPATGKDTDTATGESWNFDDANALFDTSKTGSSNLRIYGGLQSSWSHSAPAYNTTFQLLSAQPRAYIQVNPTTIPVDSVLNMKTIMTWNKADFLNGANSQTVGFNTGDSMSINFGQISANTGSATYDFRFVVEQGGSYYVSSSSKSTATLELFSIDPSAVNWAPIDTSTYTIGSFSALTLSNIEAIGVYMNMSRTGAQLIVAFDDFQADATIIPEPSTYAALAGLGALGLVALRRRRK